MESTQRYDTKLAEGDITVTNSAALVFDGSTAARTSNQFASAYDLTNNDPTNTIYLAMVNTVSNTSYWRKLDPNGGSLPLDDQKMGKGFANKVYAVAPFGNCNMHFVVKQ